MKQTFFHPYSVDSKLKSMIKAPPFPHKGRQTDKAIHMSSFQTSESVQPRIMSNGLGHKLLKMKSRDIPSCFFPFSTVPPFWFPDSSIFSFYVPAMLPKQHKPEV